MGFMWQISLRSSIFAVNSHLAKRDGPERRNGNDHCIWSNTSARNRQSSVINTLLGSVHKRQEKAPGANRRARGGRRNADINHLTGFTVTVCVSEQAGSWHQVYVSAPTIFQALNHNDKRLKVWEQLFHLVQPDLEVHMRHEIIAARYKAQISGWCSIVG